MVAEQKLVQSSERPGTFGSKPPEGVAFAYDGIIYGGVEVYIQTLIQHLDRSRFTPVVIISGYNYQFAPPLFIERIKAAGIPILSPQKKPTSRFLNFIDDVNGLRHILKETGVKVLHINTSRPDGGRRTTLAARLAGVPVVIRTEHLPPSVNATSLTRFTIKPFDWLTDTIVTDSESNREEQITLLRRNPARVYRSYCGIEPELFKPDNRTREAKEQLGLDPGIPVVGAVGRLAEQKGHTYLVDAAARIIKEFGPVNFLLVGDGPLEQQLKEQVFNLGIADYFHFAGFQTGYVQYVRAMDIAVMPSIHEGFSLIMLELMAMGKPCVVTSIPSFKEAVVDGESGLVVNEKDDKALANGILTLLRNKKYAGRLGRAATIRASSEFSIQRLANDMMDLYNALLERKGKGPSPQAFLPGRIK